MSESEQAETNSNVPTNLITQVSKEDVQEKPRKRGFFRTLCCCCFPQKVEEEPPTNLQVYNEDNEDSESGNDYSQPLLPPQKEEFKGRKTLVLDLDETLVHSSFKPIPNPDFIVPVEIEDIVHKVYVMKRPGVDQFLKEMGEIYEVVIFTASLSKYADPVLDLLDIHKVIQYRLFRESCSAFKGNYVKDLSRLGRDLHSAVIIDNSPTSYIFSQENAIGCESWFDDMEDTELLDFIPFLKKMAECDNVQDFLAEAIKKNGKFV